MYLHIGKNTTVDTEDITAVLDMDNITVAKISRDFLKQAQRRGEVRSVAEDIPKSVIVCERDGVTCVYITNISSRAITGRIRRLRSLEGYSVY